MSGPPSSSPSLPNLLETATPPSIEQSADGGAPSTGAPLWPFQHLTPKQAEDLGREVVDWHRRGKAARRVRDLLAELYLVHTDGENDGQWAEIVGNMAVVVPPKPGGTIRLQRNLLRALMDNMVAYHTAIPLRVVAEVPQGRKARDRARVSTVLANHIIQTQRLNAVLAEAMYLAGVHGHCPVHAVWRVDLTKEAYYPLGYDASNHPGMRPGYVDIFCGDPWGTVYNEGATRNSVHEASYERTLPLRQVKQQFKQIPGIPELRGARDLPSASRFQRIVRAWDSLNQFHRGSAALSAGQQREDLVGVVCRETAPGLDEAWPQGRLTCVALNGASNMDRSSGSATSSTPVLLYDGPLPCGRFSFVRFYSVNRFDDVCGKGYIADIDSLQVELNTIATMRASRLQKYSEPQLQAKSGSIDEDTLVGDPDTVMWVTSHDWPQYLTPPMGNPDYDAMARDAEAQMFRIAGWQAASRGESNAGDPAAKVVALSKADDTIFGPMNRSFQDSFVQLLQLAIALYRDYSDLPTLTQISGEELGYAVDPWVRAKDLPVEDPIFRVVSGFGATPEALAQTLGNLVVMAGADGQPILTTDEFWELHPDPSLRPHRPNPSRVKRRRLNAKVQYMETLGEQSSEEFGEQLKSDPNMLFKLAQEIEAEVFNLYPILRTEDPQQNIDGIDELVHDTTVSTLTRMVGEINQARYFDWLEQIMLATGGGMAAPAPDGPPAAVGSGTPPASSPFGGTPRSDSMSPGGLKQEVRDLTSAATAGNIR